MLRSPLLPILAGAIVCALAAIFAADATATQYSARLAAQARVAIEESGGKGIVAHFSDHGWPTRHAMLTGGVDLEDDVRARTARRLARIPGIGGVHWVDRSARASATADIPRPLHCQDDVNTLLRVRTIRFQEGSDNLDPISRELIDEVAEALKPCLGGIIAISGHTDSLGPEPKNIELSLARAAAVRDALMEHGIPADGLRALGYGSRKPIEGLEKTDPANRRIEFSVLAPTPLKPTVVDVPGAR